MAMFACRNDRWACDGPGSVFVWKSIVVDLFQRCAGDSIWLVANVLYFSALFLMWNHGCASWFASWYGLFDSSDVCFFNGGLFIPCHLDLYDLSFCAFVGGLVFVVSDFLDLDGGCAFDLLLDLTEKSV